MCLVLSLYFVFHSRTSFESSDLAINFIKGLFEFIEFIESGSVSHRLLAT